MNYTRALLLLPLTLFFSCKGQNIADKEKVALAFQAKANNYVDTSCVYLDSAYAMRQRNVIPDSIWQRYGYKLSTIRVAINDILMDSLHKMGLDEATYDRMVHGINMERVAKKNNKLKEAGLDLSVLPTTHAFELTNKVSFGNPIMEISTPQIFKEVRNDTSIIAFKGSADSTKHIAVLVSHKHLSKPVTSEQYYYSNIKDILKDGDVRVLEKYTIQINNSDAVYAVLAKKQNGIIMTLSQIYIVANGQGIIIGGGCPADIFPSYRPLWVEVARTFTTTKQ